MQTTLLSALESIMEWTDTPDEQCPSERRELHVRNAARAALACPRNVAFVNVQNQVLRIVVELESRAAHKSHMAANASDSFNRNWMRGEASAYQIAANLVRESLANIQAGE